MSYRMFFWAVVSLTMVVGCLPRLAAKDTRDNTHDGEVVSVSDDKVVMMNKDGKEHSHTLATGATVTRDGVACRTRDLAAGMKVRVTTKADDENVAIHIEAIDKNERFANIHDGVVVSIAGNQLVMTSAADNKQHSHTVAADAKVTCDGNTCTMVDLKAGLKIRVTTNANDKNVAIRIEAIDKDADFARI
jgi:hypothetical protein